MSAKTKRNANVDRYEVHTYEPSNSDTSPTLADALLILRCCDAKCKSPRAALYRMRRYRPTLTLEDVQAVWRAVRQPLKPTKRNKLCQTSR
jgi:hypothetical protein